MKKLKLAKNKVADVKQQTIFNFFKKDAPNPENISPEKKDTRKFVETQQDNIKSQDRMNSAENRPLCSTLSKDCSKNDSLCKTSNLLTAKLSDLPIMQDKITKPTTEEKLIKNNRNKENFDSSIDLKNSPDIIPPTPPVANKRKRPECAENKSAKRKFSFSESNSVSKVAHSSNSSVTIPANTDCRSKNKIDNNCNITKVSLGTCFSDLKKDESKSLNKRNPFSKLTSNIDIQDDRHNALKSECMQIDSSLKVKEKRQEAVLKRMSDSVDNRCNGHLVKDTLNTNSSVQFAKLGGNSEIDSDKEDDFGDCSFLENVNFDDTMLENSAVNLENGVRCEVMTVEYIDSCKEVVLGLKPCATCVLRGSWVNVVVREGDTVSVSARPLPGQAGCWVVDDECGVLVVHPDVLVSGTTVVGSLFCQRRSVLSDMYRGMDSDSQIMVLGSFLHELLQEVLKRKVTSLEEIKNVLDSFLLSRQFIFSLYSSQMSLDKAKETLHEFVPKIHAFLKKYIISNGNKSDGSAWNNTESWRGRITDVADIEENIWATKLGMKGKVDVTVKTALGGKHKVMPLELKTGRASFSAEHRGQVILYTMMMTELGRTVDSGLLLYLREGVMKEVQVGPVERRDLILLRNQLVTQLQASQKVIETAGQMSAPSLPPPIHHSACAKCPYLTLCSAALRMNKTSDSELSEGHPMIQLTTTSTQHVTEAHMTYVFHWSGLLRLEHTETQLKSPALHDIWTLSPQIRKKRGTCVPCVRLAGTVTEVTSGSYEHVFEWEHKEGEVACSLTEGEYVIVSSDSRAALAAGSIRHIALNQITLYLERDLSSQNGVKTWHLDKYESQYGLTFNLTNLGCMLDNTEQAERLRKSVIDLELPQFKAKLSSRVLKASVDLLMTLNDQQRRAIFRALAAEHYILIKGMPGTGKTATIVALVQLAVRLGLSVLITSHTHSAVDNVLLRLKGRIDFLRLGASHKVHPELSPYGETGHSFSSPDQLRDFYNSKSVVGVTCLGATHPLLARRQFDLCLVDEATQVLQPTVLRPLFAAHKFILIGDPDQLPPLVRTSKAKELGLGQSLFVRLDRPAVTSELSQQYRMNSRLTQLANTLTYAGKLQCASEQVAQATIQLPHLLGEVPDWVSRVLSPSLAHSVSFLDTGLSAAVHCANQMEADIVMQLLLVLKQAGLSDECVGVMAPYRAQVELLRQLACSLGSRVEVNTVDQYQGRDKDIILYSCTRSSTPTESDILSDNNRLTVAITRARHKLIFIGNVTLLRGYKLFNTVINTLTDDCIISPL